MAKTPEHAKIAIRLLVRVIETIFRLKSTKEVERYASHIELSSLLSAPQLLYQVNFYRITVGQSLALRDVYKRLNAHIRFLERIYVHYDQQAPLAKGIYEIGLVLLERDMDFDQFKRELDERGYRLAPPLYQAAFANILASRIGEQEILSFDELPSKKIGKIRTVVYALYRRTDQRLALRIDMPNFWQKDKKNLIQATRQVLILRKENQDA